MPSLPGPPSSSPANSSRVRVGAIDPEAACSLGATDSRASELGHRFRLLLALVVQKLAELWPELAREQANRSSHPLGLLGFGAALSTTSSANSTTAASSRVKVISSGRSAIGRSAISAHGRRLTPEPRLQPAPETIRRRDVLLSDAPAAGIRFSGSVAQSCARNADSGASRRCAVRRPRERTVSLSVIDLQRGRWQREDTCP